MISGCIALAAATKPSTVLRHLQDAEGYGVHTRHIQEEVSVALRNVAFSEVELLAADQGDEAPAVLRAADGVVESSTRLAEGDFDASLAAAKRALQATEEGW